MQTQQVCYSSPAVAPDGTVVYGASGGGVARALQGEGGKVLWAHNLSLFGSTMGAITADGAHVILANHSGLGKLSVRTGEVVWSSAHESNIQSAAIVLDAAGTAWVTQGHGVSMTDAHGNTTNCDIADPDGSGYNSLVAATIAADGVLLQLTIHGMMRALVG